MNRRSFLKTAAAAGAAIGLGVKGGTAKPTAAVLPAPAPADFYKCVITPNLKQYDLRSVNYSVNSLWQIMDALKKANQVVDMQGKPLPIDMFLTAVGYLRHTRERDGNPVRVVDCFCGAENEFLEAYRRWSGTPDLFQFRSFPPFSHTIITSEIAGGEVAVFRELEDRSDPAWTTQFSRNEMLLLDWSDIQAYLFSGRAAVDTPERHLAYVNFKGFA